MEVRVFISYSSRDRDLVFGEIKPLLRAAGVQTIVDCEDFAIGEDPTRNMEEAVQKNQFTLAVITQHFVESDWTAMESTRASELDRLLPIVFEMPNKIPTRIREHHTYGEALNPLEWDTVFKRLLTAIGVPPADADQALARRAPRGRESLSYRLRHGSAQAPLNNFWTAYRTAKPSYQRLRSCKELHDAFQTAQLSYRQLSDAKLAVLKALGANVAPTELDGLWKSLKTRARTLQSDLNEVLKEAEPLRTIPDAWEGAVQEGAEDLLEAVKTRDPELLKSGLEKIRGKIWTEPAFLNRTIVAERDRLALSQMCEPLAVVTSLLRAVPFDPGVAALVNVFIEAFTQFDTTGRRLLRLIENHNILQALDDGFADLDENPQPSAREIRRRWNSAREGAEKLDARDLQAEVADLKDLAVALKDWIAKEDERLKTAGGAERSPAEEAQWLEGLRERYSEFRNTVNRVFHATDSELKRVSAQLVTRLEEVQDALQKLNP